MLDKFGEVQALPLEAPSPPFGRRGTTTGPPRTPLEHSLSSMDDLTMPAMKLFTIKAPSTSNKKVKEKKMNPWSPSHPLHLLQKQHHLL